MMRLVIFSLALGTAAGQSAPFSLTIRLQTKYTIQMKWRNYPWTFIRVPNNRYGGDRDLQLEDKACSSSSGTALSNVITVTVTQ